MPLAKLASRVMAGEKLKDLGFTKEVIPPYFAIKESVFPFSRFLGAPIVLTPEMRSTGEVMGIDEDLGMAFAKTQMAVQPPLPTEGNVFISVKIQTRSAPFPSRAISPTLDSRFAPPGARRRSWPDTALRSVPSRKSARAGAPTSRT